MFKLLGKDIGKFPCLIVLVILCSCGKEPPQEPPPSVVVTPVICQEVASSFQVVGQTVAYRDVDLVARVSGFLEKRNFKEGALVKKDALLFVIEKSQYKAEVDSAIADLEKQKAVLLKDDIEYRRMKTLYEKNAVSKQNFDEAVCAQASSKADVEVSKAKLEEAKLDLSYTDVKAPFDGRVGIVTYNVGNLVGPDSNKLANIVKLHPMKVEMNISETVLITALQNRVKRNSDKKQYVLKLILANGSKYSQVGEFELWDNKINPSTGTIKVRALFPNPDSILVPGQYVKVIFETKDKTKSLLIPQASISEDQIGRYVMVVDQQNKVETKRIETSEEVGVNIVVKSGLKEGERVITQGLQRVREGIEVSPVLDKAHTSSDNEVSQDQGGKKDQPKAPDKKK